jgi:hypothetical protein
MKKALFLALLAAALPVAAESEVPQQVNVKELTKQAGVIDNVVVPLPSEIFAVLDKLGRPNWQDVMRPLGKNVTPPGGQEHTALMLGNVIAEGFVAVEAENTEEVKNIGRNVLTLSAAIGVRKTVAARSNAILDAANKKQWPQVRRELDGALRDVKAAMGELQSEELSHLVSLGGWLRGTEALTQVVQKNYTRDGAELLHQPILAEHFDKQLAGLKPRMQKDIVLKVREGLLKIRPLMGSGENVEISEKSVKEIGAIAADLVKQINQKGNQ